MNRFEQMYHNGKNTDSDLACFAVLDDPRNRTWEDCYWAAKYVYEIDESQEHFREVEVSLEEAFNSGLNIKSSHDVYLDAASIIAELYFQYSEYDLAIDYLMNIADNDEAAPDWVHADYALATIHTEDNLRRILSDPGLFFARIHRIKNDIDAGEKRTAVYKDFLNTASDYIYEHKDTEVVLNKIAKEIKEAGLMLSDSWKMFLKAVGIEYSIDEGKLLVSAGESARTDESSNDDNTGVVADISCSYLDNDANSDASSQKLRDEIRRLQNQVALLTRDNNKLKEEQESNKPQNQQTEVSDGHSLLQRNQRLLVIGASKLSSDKLGAIARDYLGFEKNDFEYALEYDRVPDLNKIRYGSRYAAIIVGPVPHKVMGLGDNTSIIQKLKNEKGFPPVYQVRTESGELKYTKDTFLKALEEAAVRLRVMKWN